MTKISVLYDLQQVELSHVRHFFEAFLGLPGVRHGAHPGSDFIFGGTSDPQVFGRPVVLAPYDPHGMPADFDPRPLLNQQHLQLLTAAERSALLQGLEAQWEQQMQHSVAEQVETSGTALLALFGHWPFAGRLHLRKAGLLRLSVSVPEAIFHAADSANRDLDVFFLGAVGLAHPLRLKITRELTRLAPALGLSYAQETHQGLKGGWRDVADFDQHQRWYADLLRRTKITPFDGSIWDWPSPRYFESMACGCLVLAPMPHDGERLGFRDGWNMVVIDGNDFLDKILYYLKHDDEREEIARNGAALIHEFHTCSARAREVLERLSRFQAGEPLDQIEEDFARRTAPRRPV